jgi:Fanconi anemia group M protein
MILVDGREQEIIEIMRNANIQFRQQPLSWGDYRIVNDNGVGIYSFERKTYVDLYNSIMDGRFEKQIPNAYSVENVGKPFLVIVGKREEFFKQYPTININVIDGAIASALVRYSIPCLKFETNYEFIRFLELTDEKVKEGKQFTSYTKTGKDPIMSKVIFLSSISGVSNTVAFEMLYKFGSIKNIVNASYEQILQIKGIGEKKAKYIYELFNDDVKAILDEVMKKIREEKK